MDDPKWPNDYMVCVRRIAVAIFFARRWFYKTFGVLKGEKVRMVSCMKAAECVWIRQAQCRVTEKQKEVEKLVLDEQLIWRCNTRLEGQGISWEVKKPDFSPG